jgi:predicted ATP-binding protein involved in virulence
MSGGYVTTIGWIVDMVARWADLSHRHGVELDGDFRDKMTGLVLIDEIDLHLHPVWQTEIVSSLRRQFPRMSFVATTHNPLTLMGAKPGEIWVLRRDAESGHVDVSQRDIREGMSADDVLTGEWFGLVSTLDTGTQDLLDQHRALLRAGVAVDDPRRQELEKKLRRRLGTFPSTSLDRMVQSIAAELMEGDFRRGSPINGRTGSSPARSATAPGR